MRNALGAATLAAALTTPIQSDAILMDLGGPQKDGPAAHTCVLSAADKTGAWDCRPESRPGNQRTPEGLLSSTRLRLEACDGVTVDKTSYSDPKHPNSVGTYASGTGAAACLPEAVAEVNRELKAHAIKCGVSFSVASTPKQPDRLEVRADCDGESK